MWKALIVEDEEIVRRNVRKLVPWDHCGFQLIGEAADGEEALAIIAREAPDLVITDIVMPMMDGLELMKRCRLLGQDCCFVVLSCMNEFEYARQAIEYGAIGYVLKLSLTVDAMKDVLRQADRRLQEQSRQAYRLYGHQYETAYERAWTELAGGSGGNAPDPVFRELWKQRELWIVSALHGEHAIALDDCLERMPPGQRDETITHKFSGFGHTTYFLWKPRSAAAPLAPSRSKRFPVVCDRYPQERSVASAWRETLERLNRLWYDGTDNGAADGRLDAAAEPGWKLDAALYQAFEQHNAAEFRRILELIGARQRESKQMFFAVKEKAASIHATLERLGFEPAVTAPQPDFIRRATTHAELMRQLEARALERLQARVRDRAPATNHPAVDDVIRYIHKHYGEPITLKQMADYAAVEKHYLSNLFKKKTGDTLTHFIQKVRLDKAKTYLLESDMTVNEISRIVGFDSDNYFIKIFKKWVGCTPKEFRLLHQAAEAASAPEAGSRG